MFLRSCRRRDLHGVAPGFQADKGIKAILNMRDSMILVRYLSVLKWKYALRTIP
jgi:hypothetical protein